MPENTTTIRRDPSERKTKLNPSSATSVRIVAARASHDIPAPAVKPIPAVAHRLAAVVSPRTIWWLKMIVPAPMKPIPLTTCAAIRLGSSDTPSCVKISEKPYCETIIMSALPNETRKWVLKPASFSRYSRSRPIIVPNSAASTRRQTKSHIIVFSIPVIVQFR